MAYALFPASETAAIGADTALLRQRVGAYEKAIILETLAREGSLRKAAKVLGVDHSTLAKKCQGYQKSAEEQAKSGENSQQ